MIGGPESPELGGASGEEVTTPSPLSLRVIVLVHAKQLLYRDSCVDVHSGRMFRTLLAVCCLLPTVASMETTLVHVSGYGAEIHAFHLTATGDLVPLSQSPGGRNPSFLAVHPHGHHAYALNEIAEGCVLAFSRDPRTGALSERGAVDSGGKGPCHLSLTPDGRWILVAHYGSGQVAVIPIDANGDLGNATDVQEAGRNAHMAMPNPAGTYVYVPCLGSHHIAQYRLDAKQGRLIPLEPPVVATAPGSGPRHLVFTADGSTAYVINELNNTITTYSVAADGTLHAGDSVPTLPSDFRGRNSTAHIALSPNGRTLWGSNRGHNSLARFTVADDGSLTPDGHAAVEDDLRTPRHFAISPDGAFLLAAAQDGGAVLRYAIQADGSLQLLGRTACAGKPCYVVFVR